MSDAPPNISAEANIFENLERLTRKPGYSHALAALSYKHKFLPPNSMLELTDGSKAGLGENIIRTEIGLLVGLFAKSARDLSTPTLETLRELIDETELLLSKLQKAIMENYTKNIVSEVSGAKSGEKQGDAEFLREAMIYAGESAYTFQYRNLSVRKYAKDDHWIVAKKGF